MPQAVKCSQTVYHMMIGLKLIALTLNKIGQCWATTSEEKKKVMKSLSVKKLVIQKNKLNEG